MLGQGPAEGIEDLQHPPNREKPHRLETGTALGLGQDVGEILETPEWQGTMRRLQSAQL